MLPNTEYYEKKCPFCGATVGGHTHCNLFCECGAKYYYCDKAWLNRKTGEEVFEKENTDEKSSDV